MKRKCLTTAILSALLFVSAYPTVATATTVQYDRDVFDSTVGDTYKDKLVARHLEPIDTNSDEYDYHLTVTGGTVWRIYAAAIGTQDELDGYNPGTAVQDSVKIHTVSGNRIFVDGVTLNQNHQSGVAVIGGGLVAHGFANENHVTISNTVIHDVYGGLSHHGSANRNEVIVNKGVEAGTYNKRVRYGVVWGGLVNEAADTHANLDHADSNRVVVNGSPDLYLGGVVGGEIRKKTSSSITGTVDGNVVIFNDGHARFAYGGVISSGEALNNEVFIHGGKIAGINGQDDGLVTGGDTDSGPASNNQITITGGTIIGPVTGGRGSETDNNQITIKGSPDLTKATLVGGTEATGQGNTLNL